MKVNRFDLIASEWDKVPRRRQIAENVSKYILDTIPLSSDMKVLDFGSGTGILAVSLQKHVKEVVALDNSKGMLEQLSQKISNHNIANISTELLDIESDTAGFIQKHKQSFDIIVSSMALHHIQDTKALLTLFRKITRPNGILALADLDIEDGTFHSNNKEAGVKHFGFDRNNLKNVIEDAGWNKIDFHTVHTVIHEDTGKPYPIFICVASIRLLNPSC